MQHFPVDSEDQKNSSTQVSGQESRQNPQNKIEDEKRSSFSKTHGQKVDHSTLNQASKADLIDKRDKHRPRDNA